MCVPSLVDLNTSLHLDLWEKFVLTQLNVYQSSPIFPVKFQISSSNPSWVGAGIWTLYENLSCSRIRNCLQGVPKVFPRTSPLRRMVTSSNVASSVGREFTIWRASENSLLAPLQFPSSNKILFFWSNESPFSSTCEFRIFHESYWSIL